jgi:preprotein translocase subunit YajC
MPMPISPAYAQATSLFGGQSVMVQMLPLLLIFVVFYFLLIRPQQRKAKDHKSMLDALRRGDRVVTGGGIIGTVSRIVSAEEVQLEIAENVRVRVLRSTIANLLSKPEPAAREGGKERVETAKRQAAEAAKRETDKV